MMQNKANRNGVRKVLVRNSIKPARPCCASNETKQVKFVKCDKESESCKEDVNFSEPEYNTVLKLVDEIKSLKLKPISELMKLDIAEPKKQCNVDYTPDEKLYHGLVTLEKSNEKLKEKPKLSNTYVNKLKKDPEPNYDELLKYSLQPVYKFTNFIAPKIKKPVPEFDGKSIYRLTESWTVRNTY